MSNSERKFDTLAPAGTPRVDPVIHSRSETPPGHDLVEGLRELGITKLGRQRVDLPAVEIGDRIRQARQSRGLTQAELARLVGCNQGDLSDIERGKGKEGPSYRVLNQLAAALNVELPVNPIAPVFALEVVEADDSAQVDRACADYESYRPLIGQQLWRRMREIADRYEFAAAASAGDVAGGSYCTLVNVGPDSSARFVHTGESAVLATIYGDGELSIVAGSGRASANAGAGAAILDAGDMVRITTSASEHLTVMTVPMNVLVNRTY